MPFIRNKAAGPRVFNLKVGAKNAFSQRVLQPGEVAELDLLQDPDQDPHLKGWIDAGEIEIVDAKAAEQPGALDFDALAKARVKAEEANAELAKLEADHAALALDTARRTPPRQLGGDGGPEQVPTVDGQGGALTKQQEEAGGRQELPPAEADKKLAERQAEAAKAAEAEKAKAEQAKPAPRGR